MKKTVASLVLLVTTLIGPGCGLLPQAAGLFDLRMLLLPKPGATRVQALCAEGNQGEQDARALVDSLNASIEADRALLEAVAAAEPESEGPISTYEVTVDGRTMVIELITSGDQNSFTGTIDGEQVLDGATADGGSQGAVTYNDIEVAWHTTDGLLRAARTHGDVDAALVLEETQVAIVVDETIAAWNDDTGVFMEGESIQCWAGGERCDTTCDQGELDVLVSDVETSAARDL